MSGLKSCETCNGDGSVPLDDFDYTDCTDCRGLGYDNAELLEALGVKQRLDRAQAIIDQAEIADLKSSQLEASNALFRRALRQIQKMRSQKPRLDSADIQGKFLVIRIELPDQDAGKLAGQALSEKALGK